jgi:6-phospho-3-hexuloisomerase
MNATSYVSIIVKELESSVAQISAAEADALSELLLSSSRIFVAGAGRSGLMGRAFAMRLMHCGLQVYVVGEAVTPGIGEGDVLVLGTGSGETKSLVSMAQKAKSVGASVAAVTIHPDSTIGQLADLIVRLPGASKEQQESRAATVQPMASLFEQTLLLFYDGIVLGLMNKQGLESGQMYGKHANLE